MLIDLTSPSRSTKALQDRLNAQFQWNLRPATVLHGALTNVVKPSPHQQLAAALQTSHGHELVQYSRSYWYSLASLGRTALHLPSTERTKGPSHPNGRYGAPIPTAPTPVPDTLWPLMGPSMPSYQTILIEANPWGDAARWFYALSHTSFQQLLHQLPELRAAFISRLNDRNVPLDARGTPALLEERVARSTMEWNVATPVLDDACAAWTTQMIDHLSRRAIPSWIRACGIARVIAYDHSEIDLTPDNLRTVQALAQEVHTQWVSSCGQTVRHLVPTLFSRHAVAMAIEPTVRPVEPRHPSIAHAPLLRHLAQNPDWDVHPDQGLEVASTLLDMGAPVDVVARQSPSPLSVAVRNNRRTLVHWLLDHGADIDRPSADLRPVHLALTCGHVDLAKDLLRRGARHRLASAHVSHAPMLKHLVRLLVDSGTNVNEHLSDQDLVRTRQTVLHWAVAQDLPAMVAWLITRGADPSIQDHHQRSAWDLATTVQKHRSTLTQLQGPLATRSIAQVLHEAFLAHERQALHEVLHNAPFPGTMEGVAEPGAVPAEDRSCVAPRSRSRL